MTPKTGPSCGDTGRVMDKRTTGAAGESSSASSVSSATGPPETIELCKGLDTKQVYPDSGGQGKNEAAEIEVLAGCGCFPRRLRTKHTGSKSKKVTHCVSLGALTDTFYEEKDPERRPYDLPSYGSGGAHRSARASQRHFRECLKQ